MFPFVSEAPKAPASQLYLEGPKVELPENYGGLGAYYLDRLYENMEKIHQIDTVTGVTETSGSVRSRALQVAHELRCQGVTENDIVVVCSRCHADQTVVVLACLLLGCMVAPLDPDLHHDECAALLRQLHPCMCFCDLRTLKQMERIVAETELDTRMVHFSDQQQYAMAFRKLLAGRQQAEQFVPVVVEQPRKRVAFILSTQGAFGPPKLVCLSHHFVYSQTQVLRNVTGCSLRLLSFYPLSCVLQVFLTCLCFETSTVRVLMGPFAERTACKLIHDLKVDHVFLNTELALRLIDDVAIKDFNMSCLRGVFVGGLTTTIGDLKKLLYRLPGVRFTQMYCTTETGVVTASTPVDYIESLERIGSIGKVVPNYKLRIVDVETMADVEPDYIGELMVAGDCLMLGYLKNLTATKAAMFDGYFKTGDLVKYDSAGWLFLQGRVEDLLVVGDKKMLPRGIEEVILQHPFVQDAAVINNDQEVVACVILKENTKLCDSNLLAFISERVTPDLLPDRVVFLEEFPTTPQGKVKRNMLKEAVVKLKIEHSGSMPLINSETCVTE